ncbi:MAG: methylenetetrahydrofolate reductase [NAD(P)H] [Methylococcales bacterium]|nr:methylenetetrahydrofolate reductase [NAD(P)H] [Methylococcales bacterium]
MTHCIIPPLQNDIAISFEFFPPSGPKSEARLWQTLSKLAPLNPDFVSVTYGAGGTTQDRTFETVVRIKDDLDIPATSHLTIVGATKDEINKLLLEYKAAGITGILALRGDAPEGHGSFTPHPDGFQNSIELIEHIQAMGGFEVSVAAYPETHPRANSPIADLDYLKRKMDAGATRAITQFFFDADAFLRFRDLAFTAGITIPIIPGILPVTNYRRVEGFAKACGASIPPWFHSIFDGLDDNPRLRELVAVTVASELVLQLKNEGVKDFHIYTLNKWESTEAICNVLGVPQISGRRAA